MALKTIASDTLYPNYQYGGSTFTVRLYYTENFIDNQGRSVFQGAVGSDGFFGEVAGIVSTGLGIIDEFTLITTEDSDHPNARVIGVLYDSNDTMRDVLFDWAVPPEGTIATPTTFAVMQAYNQRNTIINPSQYYLDQFQVIILVTAMLNALGFGPATAVALGLVRLRIAAADPADPEVYGTNDPRVRDAVKVQGTSVSAVPPADLNILQYSALDGFASWAAFVLRGITPNTRTVLVADSGTDDDDVVFLNPTANPDFNFTFMTASTRTTPFTVKNIATNANAVNLLPLGPDTIDGVADPTPTPLPAGVSMTFIPRTATAWESF